MSEWADTLPGLEPIPKSHPRPSGRLVQVQPDITAIDQSFTYEVPTNWETDGRAERVAVGSLVRVDFGGRRTAGWVTAVDVEHDPSVAVAELAKWSSVGPPLSVIELLDWATHRWYGRRAHFLRAASPPKMVAQVATAGIQSAKEPGVVGPMHALFDKLGVSVVETPPADRGVDLAIGAAAKGHALILVPTIADRRHLAKALRDNGVPAAEYPDQWGRSAAGAVTIGTRLGALAPIDAIDAVLVLDEHDTAYKEERTPSWNARDIAIERARRSGAPCVLASPTPTLEALELAERRLVPERSAQRNGWPHVQVIDMRRAENPGLLSAELVDVVRGDGTVACILNRKGRAQMLACARCDSLADCEACGAAVQQPDNDLVCRACGTRRPVVCGECGSTAFKLIRPGLSRVAEELAALAKRPVVEVTAETEEKEFRSEHLFIGTEALLHRIDSARAVVFLDFDQQLAQPRTRAAEQAFALLALAARRVGRRAGGGRVMVQTRRPNDPVIDAAVHGEPGRVARAQQNVRMQLQQPPYGAWALVSGAGGEDFIASLESLDSTVQIRHLGDRWRVSAQNHDELLGALHAAERPGERLRVEVDPLDI